jgi:hypothetical protein
VAHGNCRTCSSLRSAINVRRRLMRLSLPTRLSRSHSAADAPRPKPGAYCLAYSVAPYAAACRITGSPPEGISVCSLCALAPRFLAHAILGRSQSLEIPNYCVRNHSILAHATILIRASARITPDRGDAMTRGTGPGPTRAAITNERRCDRNRKPRPVFVAHSGRGDLRLRIYSSRSSSSQSSSSTSTSNSSNSGS